MAAQVFTLLVFGGMGLMFLVVGARQWRLQHRLMRRARPVPARVVERTLPCTDPDDGGTVAPRRFAFRYHLGGRAYESDMIHPNVIVEGDGEQDERAGTLAGHPVGASVMVYVDPAHPDKGFLTPRAGRGPAVFVALGLALPPAAWWIGGLL